MRFNFSIALLLLLVLFHNPDVRADLRKSLSNCSATESAQITVSFSGVEVDAANISGKVDNKIDELEKIAKEAGMQNVAVQATNYSVSTQSYGNSLSPQYQFNGSITLTLHPIKQAEEFYVVLSKKGFQANLNVNRYVSDSNCTSISG